MTQQVAIALALGGFFLCGLTLGLVLGYRWVVLLSRETEQRIASKVKWKSTVDHDSASLVWVLEFVGERDGKFLHRVRCLDGRVQNAYTTCNSLGSGVKCGLHEVDGMPMLFCNCPNCGRGSSGWSGGHDGIQKCLCCDGDPLKGTGREDWKSWERSKYVAHFGVRNEGDEELLEEYFDDLRESGWLR